MVFNFSTVQCFPPSARMELAGRSKRGRHDALFGHPLKAKQFQHAWRATGGLQGLVRTCWNQVGIELEPFRPDTTRARRYTSSAITMLTNTADANLMDTGQLFANFGYYYTIASIFERACKPPGATCTRFGILRVSEGGQKRIHDGGSRYPNQEQHLVMKNFKCVVLCPKVFLCVFISLCVPDISLIFPSCD